MPAGLRASPGPPKAFSQVSGISVISSGSVGPLKVHRLRPMAYSVLSTGPTRTRGANTGRGSPPGENALPSTSTSPLGFGIPSSRSVPLPRAFATWRHMDASNRGDSGLSKGKKTRMPTLRWCAPRTVRMRCATETRRGLMTRMRL